MKKYPEWCYRARHAMVDRDLTVTELAKAIGTGRTTVSGVLCGSVVNVKCIKAISDYLNIKDDYAFNVSDLSGEG